MSEKTTRDDPQNQILQLTAKCRGYEATISSLKEEIETHQEKQLPSEERYRALYENAPLPYQSLNGDGCFVDVNLTWLKVLGYCREEVIGNSYRDFLHPDWRLSFDQNFPAFKRRGYVNDVQYKIRHKDGHFLDIAFRGCVGYNPDGSFRQTYCIFDDISEKLEQERQLRQKSKMEAVGVMAGGMAHNFNNNLSIILGNLELIRMKHPTNPEIHKRLEDTQTAALRSRDLIRNIMLYSRQGELGEMVPLKLTPLIAETMQLLGPTIPTSITIEQLNTCQNRQDLAVYANASQLQECLINLCNNSVHAMNEKGTITVSIETEELSQKDIPLQYDAQPGSYAKVSVTDTGCGIPPDAVERVFDLFYTTKPDNEGSGIGLSTVMGIIKKHGGLIRVQSIEGQGTTFAMYLPIIEQIDSSVEKKPNQTVPGGSEQILLVDDDPQVAELVKKMLLSHGYTVFLMTDSQDASMFFSENADHIDLVITDQTMPKLTGLELCAEVKKVSPDMPIILCTGYSSKVDVFAIEEFHVSALLLKPFDVDALLQTVRRVLDKFHNS
jgi:PAS domain S-box-containing protein